VAATLLLGACGARAGSPGVSSKPKVVASFYPLAFAAEAVAGDNAAVSNLAPAGVEPHDIELTSSQVVAISEADVLVFAGRGFQPAVESLAANIGDRAVDVLDQRALAGRSPARGAGGGDLEGRASDPHVWLDPARMAAIADVIADRLARVDPDNAGAYRSSGTHLRAGLHELDRRFARGLEHCDGREIITSHEAFGYLADRYDLAQIGIAGLDPEGEPSPQRVAYVTELARDHDVTTIFFETLASPRVAETIAAEAGLRTAVLDPIESAPERGDYFDAMTTNLESLRTALRCK
jgi:zinc transport system substrate-binding protein